MKWPILKFRLIPITNAMTIFLILIGGAVVTGAVLYNRLVRDSNLVREAWSGIDVQLKRRHDLIPKIVQLVASYMSYEKKTLEDVTSLRTRGQAATNLAEREEIEARLTEGIKNIFVVAENYPELKASQSFSDLQKSITEVEDHLQMARRYYNGTVRNFNVRIASFPSFFLARSFGFTPRDYFQAESQEREVPASA